MKKISLLGSAIAMMAALVISLPTPVLAQDKKAEPKAAPKAAPKPAAKKEAKADPTEQAVLLGQFNDWGAYKATPGGKKICFALAKPSAATIDPPTKKRDPSYAFISTRPSEKVKNEVSMIVGYPQKDGVDASASVGSSNYVMYTQGDGTWVKNAAEEAQMVDAMRKGSDLVVKSVSKSGAKTTDTYALKGLREALEKITSDPECK
jgi:hypothetical protein